MGTFRYNVTIHCTRQISEEVLDYLRKELVPTWSTYEHWHSPKLLRIHTGMGDEDMVAYALQFECDDLEKLSSFDEQRDPVLRRIMEAYSQRVMPFSVVMEVLE
ncbi:DUF4286 family protein [Porphyromonas sp.]|uniref:DUF4286 family protein n=1 Tax=Porphyromonas sp. TaxID=1924944 RepID=UPI0026DD66D1|nr:DUF4286 family protein [Porphyromonas sp.]MDO4771139.1 DUF4286 family protein [Porphyromonas sp.]